jgi:hypothetical protein
LSNDGLWRLGDDEDRASAGLALVELRLELAEELGVVVDVLGVLDRDAAGLLEVRNRLLVDVQRPVRDRELAAHLARGIDRGDLLVAPATDLVAAAAASREQQDRRQARECQRHPDDRPTASPCLH